MNEHSTTRSSSAFFPSTPSDSNTYIIGPGTGSADLLIPIDAILGLGTNRWARALSHNMFSPSVRNDMSTIGSCVYFPESEWSTGEMVTDHIDDEVMFGYDYDELANTLELYYHGTSSDGTTSPPSDPHKFEILTAGEVTALSGSSLILASSAAGISGTTGLALTTDDVPYPWDIDSSKIYSGKTHNGATNKLTFVSRFDANRIVVIDQASLDLTFGFVASTSQTIVTPSSKYGLITEDNVVVKIREENDGTISTIPAEVVHKNDFIYKATVNADEPVPGILVPGTIYTGTTYNNLTNKITLLDPHNPNEVLIADKPTGFNTLVGGVRIS